ncbi:MAG: aspartate/glutamate racemase family protein [Boseongicola sp.]|nr:aspartate/glutamate racemase family protein [Boseongicola sp.]
MTLYVINPNSSEHVTQGLREALEPFHVWGQPIRCLTLEEGPPGIETQEHIDGVVEPILHLAGTLSDASGFVIACFSDPGVDRLRAQTGVPVLGIREAAVTAALTLGSRFGIIAIRPASIPRHLSAISEMGLSNRLAGDRAINLGVTELANEDQTLDRLMATAKTLKTEDGAEVLILGCAGMAHYRARLEIATGLPTIDPTQSAAAMALSRIALRQSHKPEVPHA